MSRCSVDASCRRRGARRGLVVGRRGWAGALLSVVLLCLVLGVGGVEAVMRFTLSNVAEPSLYQSVQVLLTSNTLQGDPAITTGDILYFVPSTSAAASCTVTGTGTAADVTVTSTSTGGFTGQAQAVITSDVFTVGNTYVGCYVSAAAQTATVVQREAATGAATSMTVWPALYTGYALTPASPTGGEGPVLLSITEATQTGRPANQGIGGTFAPLLAPCTDSASCTNLNTLTRACAAGNNLTGRVVVSGVTGVGSGTITGSFSVPYVPNSAGYFFCVPYCNAAGCGTTSTRAMSYALVAASDALSVTFAAANPGTYTRTPASPQARERGFITFSGTGLSAQDEVRVLAAGQSCTSSTASLLPNMELGTLEVVTQGTSTVISFVAPDLVDSQIVGAVCYRKASSNLWAPAYLSATNPVADFTIDVLQPTGFTMSPATAQVGDTITLLFAGTGLDASTDAAFLSLSTASDPCTDPTNAETSFTCTLTAGAGGAPLCTVLVDPPNSNQAAELTVCYQKFSSGMLNFAAIRGTVSLGARDPTFAISPYPMYAGQTVSLDMVGTGLSAADTVKLIPLDGTCAGSAALQTATLTFQSAIVAGEQNRYSLLGSPDVCFLVCYLRTGSTNWQLSRPTAPLAGLATAATSCPNGVYIAPYPIRYDFALPTGAVPTSAETLTLQLSAASGIVVGTSEFPSSVKLVAAGDNCAVTACGGVGAACTQAADAGSYSSTLSGANSATVLFSSPATAYIICVTTANGGDAYIPVLPTGAASTNSVTFSFTTAVQNAVFALRTPAELWHVGVATLSTVFTGTGLNASTDAVFAVAATTLIADQVCPLPTATIPVLMPTTTNATTSSEVLTEAYSTRSHLLETGTVVHYCYRWSSGGVARITYGGSVSMLTPVPSELTWLLMPETGYAAGLPFIANFTTNSSIQLTPGNAAAGTGDSVFFYRYVTSSNPSPNCFCNPQACSGGTFVSYDGEDGGFMSTSTSTSTQYGNSAGFDNYGYEATYIVCYSVANLQSSVVYAGRINVQMANPTYFTATTVAGSGVFRVGAPFTVTAVRRCFSANCDPLLATDSLILLNSSRVCAAVNDATVSDAVVEMIDNSPTVGSNGLSYSRRFVVDVEGTYRVCYRPTSAGTGSFHELVFTSSYLQQPITVTTANPVSFTAFPESPFAGQFTTVDLTCTGTLCNNCQSLSIIEGARVNCWNESTWSANVYTSQNCLLTTSIQFPDQYLTEGNYTLCYGSTRSTARRLPGQLVVRAANPSVFAPAGTSKSIFTNQASDYTLLVTGTGLMTSDAIFLLPESGFSCHDLRTGEIQANGTIAEWLTPSVNPYPLVVTDTGVSWVASNEGRRFRNGLLTDSTLCPGGDGSSCAMKLCYRRDGMTWAPVSISEPPPVSVVASNPASVTFDRYPLVLDMYAMATVAGADLVATDVLAIHDGGCSGAVMTVLVGSPVTSDDGTQWIGVVRFNSSSTTALSVACYWRGDVATEVATVFLPGQSDSVINVISTPLYYMLYPTNYTSASWSLTLYEELMVGGTFYNTGSTLETLLSASLITNDTAVAECNYEPFFTVSPAATRFPVVEVLEAVSVPPAGESGGSAATASTEFFNGRLTATGTYALCMEIADYGLFRVVTRPPEAARATAAPTELIVYDANPATYSTFPLLPMVSQTAAINLAAPTIDAAPYALAVGDDAQLINGTLYECGFGNATVIGTGVVDELNATTGAAIVRILIDAATPGLEGLTQVVYATLCYRKQGGTFAAVPNDIDSSGLLVPDRNFPIAPRMPIEWTQSVAQAQAGTALSLTFYPVGTITTFFTIADRAFLVEVDPTNATAITTAALSALCLERQLTANLTQSTDMTFSGTNTVWSIPAGPLVEGSYAVCYVAANNQVPVYVPNPPLLTIYAPQSPTGAYTNMGDTLTVTQGLRFYLFFNTTVALNVIYDTGSLTSEESTTRDVVRIATDATCATTLVSPDIDLIPESFGYAPLVIPNPADGGATNVPYLHLRVRAAVGSYYICMRRTNRESWQAFYDYTVIGAAFGSPAMLEVVAAPVESFVTVPSLPRVWAPQTSFTLTYAQGVTLAQVAQLFLVPFAGTDPNSANEILDDLCYLPPTEADASGPDVPLVNTTLQVLRATLEAQYIFETAGLYLLCYQLEGAFIASVFPNALTVNPPSPIAYSVPSGIATAAVFGMSFYAIDPIFGSTGNVARIYVVDESAVNDPLNCTDATAPTGGTSQFTSFTLANGNTSQASVQPQLLTAGYYYVCFLTYDQVASFPVPNLAGGFVFSVGLTGGQSYTVTPSPGYLGEYLDLLITGNQLSSSDHVKIVNVTGVAVTDPVDYNAYCTAEAINADARVAEGDTVGSVVDSPNGITAHYYPMTLTVGTFILCYQSILLSNAWAWVSRVSSFTVVSAHPTSYELWPDPAYATEVDMLYVRDADGLLSSADQVRLVTRGSGGGSSTTTTPGLDCTPDAIQSSSIGALAFVAAQSNANVNTYRVCGTTAVSVTVCYQLAGRQTWAEVPLSSPPPSYDYQPAVFEPSPFTGPTVVPSAPRPYEPFDISFTNSAGGSTATVTFLGFALSPVSICALQVPYVTPTYYLRNTTVVSTFRVALPFSGTFMLYLGTRDTVTSPNITHGSPLTIAPCDPCEVTPTYTFVGTTVTLAVPSRFGGTLSTGDALRLIPTSQGAAGLPCEAPTGPFASETFAPGTTSSPDETYFSVTAGATTEATNFIGDYYVCYRKGTSGNFALIVNDVGTLATFAVYPDTVDISTTFCPAQLYGGETVVFNITVADVGFSMVSSIFSVTDELVAVPQDVLTNCSAIESVTQVQVLSGNRAVLPILDNFTTASSNWYSTLPSLVDSSSYVICFRLAYSTTFRSLSSTVMTVGPENPNSLVTTPAVILPDTTGVVITVTGTGLLNNDNIYLVLSNESCAETCGNAPLTPTVWTGVMYTRQYVSSTTVQLVFAEAIGETLTWNVCYRRFGYYLTTLGTVHVGEPNPISYTVNFVPRVRTRPTLTFTGVGLGVGDSFLLVLPGQMCVERNAVVSGVFVSASTDGTTSSFTVELMPPVTARNYTVCYHLANTTGYVVVPPELPVLPGPQGFTTSNTPMRGRAFHLHITPTTNVAYVSIQAGDSIFVACPGCSCYVDDISTSFATAAYGVVSDTVTAANVDSFSLRLGFSAADGTTYPVCYRVADSGYGPLPNSIVLRANSPTIADIFPLPTFQGQRLTYNFTNFTTVFPVQSTDAVMLVQSTRLCWDNETLLPTQIVVAPSVLNSVDLQGSAGTTVAPPTTSVATWLSHVPSLGPDTPASTLFPLSYALCYRESGQSEFVSVPFPLPTTPDSMASANPATFTTTPTTVAAGMIGVQVTFPNAADGDEVYAVQFTVLTNTVCTDEGGTSVVIAERAAAFPSYTLNVPGDAVVSNNNTAFCYIRANATVAEVPQLLPIVAGNPSGYEVNVTADAARERQYLEFVVVGTGLSAATDAVVFTEGTCAASNLTGIPTSTAYLARLSDFVSSADGTTNTFVAQFVAPVAPVTLHLCYSLAGVWTSVGAPLTLAAPQPSAVTVTHADGSATGPVRAGQNLYLELVDGAAVPPYLAAVIEDGDGAESWCHNFTQIREPSLAIVSELLLSVSVWEQPGAARVCLMNNISLPWTDAQTTVQEANPSAMVPFPVPPRVGQKVTLTFLLVVAANAGDMVKITSYSYEACAAAASLTGFPATMPVTVIDANTTSIELTDETDPLLYRSFNATGTYRVCYFSATEQVWAVVGGSLITGSLVVEERVPQQWTAVDSTEALVVGRPFALNFTDVLGVLNAAGGDYAWAAPSTVNCGVEPTTCTQCVIFEWDLSRSTAFYSVTQQTTAFIVDNMNLCYRLANATASLVPGGLNITTNPVECTTTTTAVRGQYQEVTFRLQEGTDVTGDDWQVSFYGSRFNCELGLDPSFVPGRAALLATTATSATYGVEWPVNMTDDRYTICYERGGQYFSVCTCAQLDGGSGDCYITVTPNSPESFVPSPHPTYVGQTITLFLNLQATLTAYPPTQVQLVEYVDQLTTCQGAAAFTPANSSLTMVNATQYAYTFKHDYLLGSSRLLVCVMTGLSTRFSRVGSVAVDNLLWIRPYLQLSSFPTLDSVYLRAMQTLTWNFTMQSRLADDVVSLADEFTLVQNPYDCVEGVIDAMNPATVMSWLLADDSAFVTVPAAVSAADAAQFTTRTTVTFSTAGGYYVCYRLAGATWAPVMPLVTVQTSAVSSCSLDFTPSAANGVTSTVPRAMQYVPTSVIGDSLFASLGSDADAVRIMPQNRLCSDNTAAIASVAIVRDPSGTAATTVSTVIFAAEAGSYKLCYRFGGASSTVANWSPACTQLNFTAPSPVGSNVGCLNVGQTVNVSATQSDASLVYTATDTFRFVSGNDPCLFPDGTTTSILGSVYIDDVAQQLPGLAVGTSASMSTSAFDMPYVLLGSGTNSIRLCYRDAAGNQFAVPLDYAAQPTVSSLAVAARQPTTVTFPGNQGQFNLGQRLLMNFSAAATTVTPALLPYAAVPTPILGPGPAFDGTFDASSMLLLSNAVGYRDGRCAAAFRTATAAATSLTLNGVYGPTSRRYTVGVFAPAEAQYYVACYRLATCGVTDVGTPLQVLPANPSTVWTGEPSPRRGQLITVYFTRAASGVPLTPGADRATKQAGLSSCWLLPDNAGSLVSGTTETTNLVTILYAQPPATAVANTSTRTCYRLAAGSWSEVPRGVAGVLAANPSAFTVASGVARTSQRNTLLFHGYSLRQGDTAKIIPLSLNCSDESVPPTEIVGLSSDDGVTPLPGGSAGWPVGLYAGDTTGATTMIDFTASATGTFSVCYKMAADTVWTLVYSNLVIYDRNPATVSQTPISTLEQELFTLTFTAATATGATGAAALSADDRLVLYFGNDVNCLSPGQVDKIRTSPSRTDGLPGTISFQADAGTRGNYTVCYQSYNAADDGGGSFTPVWGFPVVVVQPNPVSWQLFPAGATTTTANVIAPGQVSTIVFSGFGLISVPGKRDEVKLIDGTLPYTDAACRSNAVAATVRDSGGAGLVANGTHAEYRFFSAPGAAASYWVCYRLEGGQFHVVGDLISVSGTAANPSSATSSKDVSTNGLSVGEATNWTLAGLTGCSTTGDTVAFYSSNNCSDIPYYLSPAAVVPSETLFPLGYQAVDCATSTVESLRLGYTTVTAGQAVSLCVYHNSTGAVTVVNDRGIPINAGTPPALATTLAAQAQQIFAFELAVTPTTTDYVALVVDPVACAGVTVPTTANAALFARIGATDAAAGTVEIVAAVPAAGTYYVCYSHQQGVCAPSANRDCARVVGEVRATAAAPTSWTASPSSVYVGDSQTVTFYFGGDVAAAAAQSTAAVRLARLDSASETGASGDMFDVAAACAAAAGAAGDAGFGGATVAPPSVVVNLTFDAVAGTWQTGALATSGRYALCYQEGGATATRLAPAVSATTIFAPFSAAGPVVVAGAITSVVLPDPAVAAEEGIIVVVNGGGLSSTDVMEAVGVPSGTTTIPSDDVCTNATYSPRITASLRSLSAGGSSGVWSIPVTQSGSYVLCYDALALGAPAPVDLAGVFVVFPRVDGVSGLLEVNRASALTLSGSGFTGDNRVALVACGGSSAGAAPCSNVTAVCATTAVDALYQPFTTVNATVGSFTATPTVAGDHVVCLRSSAGGPPLLVPQVLTANVYTASAITFATSMDGCGVMKVCDTQPVIQVLNASGLPAVAPPLSTLALQLLDSATGAALQRLIGAQYYVTTDNSVFTFLALRVSTEGTYVLRAALTFPDGVTTLTANSAAFTVTSSTGGDGGSGGVALATLSCTPNGILYRNESAAPTNCSLTPVGALRPSNYSIQVTSGAVATPCVAAGAPAGAFCHFTVSPPTVAQGGVPINFIAITVTPAAPYEAYPVTDSPFIQRIAALPEAQTSLSCTRASNNTAPALPSANLVRAGELLDCSVQGRQLVNGVAVDIVAQPTDLQVSSQYNSDPATSTPVNLGAYPTGANGQYLFALPVESAQLLQVMGSVVDTSAAVAWQQMTNSPQNLTVLGVPAAPATTMSCLSTVTQSTRYYLPTESFACTAVLRSASGAVINGIGSVDYSLTMPQGGSHSALPSTASTELNVTGSAPPQGGPPASAVMAPTVRERRTRLASAETLASSYDYTYQVQLTYTPNSGTTVATYTGVLVYVSSVLSPLPSLLSGKSAQVGLVGSGLDTLHHYVISTSADCTAVTSTASATAGSALGSVLLSFTVPNAGSFFVCFAPVDAPNVLQLLYPQAFLPGGDNSWTTADLALFIVGLIVLVILLVLMIILWWCICCAARRYGGGGGGRGKHSKKSTSSHHYQHHHMRTGPGGSADYYIPPPLNNRFVYHHGDGLAAAAAVSPAPQSLPSAAPVPLLTAPPPPPATTTTTTNTADNTRIRVNINDERSAVGTAQPQLLHLNPQQQATAPAPFADLPRRGRYQDPESVSTSTTTTTVSTADQRRRKHRHSSGRRRQDSDTSTADQDRPHRRRHGSSTPPVVPSTAPLPPPPFSSLPRRRADESPDLVHTPRDSAYPANLPPLPTRPVQGPYQHLHYQPTTTHPNALSAPSTVPSITRSQVPPPSQIEDPADDSPSPGAYSVTGHTSRPMVSRKRD